MKTYVLLFCMLTLASCVGSSGRRDLLPKEDTKTEELEQKTPLKAGQIIRTTVTGSSYKILELDEKGELKLEEVDLEIFAVVLKVTGDNFYEYKETTNLLTGKISKEVNLKGIGDDSGYAKFTPGGLTSFDGYYEIKDIRKVTKTFPNNLKVKLIENNFTKYKKGNSLCDSSNEVDETVVIFKDNQEISSDYTSSFAKIACETVISNEAINTINLESIKFCDTTGESEVCRTANLEHLKKK